MTVGASALRAAPLEVRGVRALLGAPGPSGSRAVADRCADLAGARGPVRRAMAAVAHRFVEAKAWERLGFARLGDYARERVGLSARTLHDLAHVDACLRELPRIEAALVAGRLTWTQARLLARVATEEDEASWLAHARRVTARQLAREVRAVDRGSLEAGGPESDEDGIAEVEKETVEIRCTPAVRARWFHARQLAQRVAGERLTAPAVLETVTAEVLSAVTLDANSDEPRCETRAVSWLDRLAESAEAGQGPSRHSGSPLRLAPSECQSRSGPAAPPFPVPETAAGPGSNRRRASRSEGEGGCGPDDHRAFRPAVEGMRRPECEGAPDWREPSDVTIRPKACEGPPEGLRLSSWPHDTSDHRGPARARLPVFLERLVAHLAEADAFELDRRLRVLVSFEQRLDAEVGAQLARVAAGRRYRFVGARTMEDYARERLGLSPRKARALLRLERAGAVCPELARAYRAGRLSWVQAQTLLPLVLLDDAWRWRRGWIGWARRVSVRRLEDDVERALVLRETDPDAWSESGGLPQAGDGEVGRERERQTGARPRASEETTRVFVVAPRDVTRLFRAVLCSVRRRLEPGAGRSVSAGEGFGAMLDHAIATWGGPNPRKRSEWRVFERDGWRCTAPGCSSRRNLHDHHIRFRSAGGSDALRNRTTLCAWHHLRGVHAGIVRCTGEAPHRLRFDLGVRRGAPPLARYRSGDVALANAASTGSSKCG